MSDVAVVRGPTHIKEICKPEDTVAFKRQIADVVKKMAELPERQKVDVETMHHFVGDIYARTVLVRAGTLVAGYTHKKECLVIVSLGVATVATRDGVVHLTAPAIFSAPAGSQRIGFHHTDTIWTTVHTTTERDIDKIEAELFNLEENPCRV